MGWLNMTRREELDFARVTAMIAVVLLHATSTFVFDEESRTVLGMNLAFILNQWSRFAVPMFVLISGVSLNLSRRPEGLCAFWKRRALRVVPPFLIWSTIYAMYNAGFDLQRFAADAAADPLPFFRHILLGQTAPHLYFILILIQCYVLYPAIKKALGISKFGTVLFAFALTLTMQSLLAFKRQQLDLIPNVLEPHLYWLFPTWAFYFTLGAAISGDDLEKISAFSRKHARSLVVVTAIFSALYIIDAHLTRDLDSIKPSLNIYTVLMLMSAFAVWGAVERHAVLRRATCFLSEHSMSIYFSHILILSFFRRYSFLNTGMLGMLCLFLLVLLSSTLFSFFLDTAVSRLKRLAHAHPSA